MLKVFHGWPIAMKYSWNAFIGHEGVSFHGFITKTVHKQFMKCYL